MCNGHESDAYPRGIAVCLEALTVSVLSDGHGKAPYGWTCHSRSEGSALVLALFCNITCFWLKNIALSQPSSYWIMNQASKSCKIVPHLSRVSSLRYLQWSSIASYECDGNITFAAKLTWYSSRKVWLYPFNVALWCFQWAGWWRHKMAETQLSLTVWTL